MSHTGLQRHRKSLLSDLSALVRISKVCEAKMEEASLGALDEGDCSQLVLSTFQVVIRAVRFYDSWLQVCVTNQDVRTSRFSDHVIGRPPTPPSEVRYFDCVEKSKHEKPLVIMAERSMDDHVTPGDPMTGLVRQDSEMQQNKNSRPDRTETSTSFSTKPSPCLPACLQSSPQLLTTGQAKRQSVSHRVSWLTKPAGIRNDKLASYRLISANEIFLSYLSVFLGIHLITRTPVEVLVNTQQAVNAGRSLLTVVEAVWDRGLCQSKGLEEKRDAMYTRVTDLVRAAQQVFQPLDGSEKEDFNVEDRKSLSDAAMSCVKGAGDCVDATRRILESIGDFEFETIGLQSAFSGVDFQSAEQFPQETREERNSTLMQQFPMPPDSSASTGSTPCSPNYPHTEHLTSTTMSYELQSDTIPSTVDRSSLTSLLPPPPSLTDSVSSLADFSPLSATSNSGALGFQDDPFQARKDGGEPPNPMSGSTFATCNPEMNASVWAIASPHSSESTLTDSPTILSPTNTVLPLLATTEGDIEEVEANVMRKTFAHELAFNKNGQITGGTLPALIERLTSSDARPDAVFVSTFYLTFRLFSSAMEVASALVERFNYCSHDKLASGAVTLRVYNVFKGWLESHWRHDCDSTALPVVESFALNELARSQPGASNRLLELTRKVSETQMPPVPRNFASLGRTAAVSPQQGEDTSFPLPVISKGQLGLLKSWKNGAGHPTILDFEPLELARQLTVKASNLFCSILPEELLGAEWTKKSGSVAHNVRAMSTLSTDMTNLVADTVLQFEDHSKRAKIIKHWVKIANKCLDLNNYDSVIAIVCSLNSTPILRLKRTWDCLSSKTKASFNHLKSTVDCSRNYIVLRQRLLIAVPPCLPFVGMYLTDLTFVDAGNSSTRKLSLSGQDAHTTVINFDKHLKTAKIISDLQRFQLPYWLQEVSELQAWLQEQFVRVRSSVDSGESSVNKMYRRSCLLEPREQVASRPTLTAVASAGSQLSRLQKREGEFMGISWR